MISSVTIKVRAASAHARREQRFIALRLVRKIFEKRANEENGLESVTSLMIVQIFGSISIYVERTFKNMK